MILRPRAALAMVALLFTLSACNPNRFVSGWVPYWGATAGRAGYSDAQGATLFSEVSPFWYSATSATNISLVGTLASLNSTVTAARAKGLPVIPSITDGTGKLVMAGILANAATRAAHVNAIVGLVNSKGFDGIDLDYEGFAFTDGSSSWATTQPNWVQFVHDLADALHANGKLLSITIPPEGTVANYWVYSQQLIADAADRIRLMVYDYSVTSPGPIAPMSWVNQVIAWSSTRVPLSKLQLGVPAYGRHWRTQADTKQTCPDGSLFRTSPTMKDAAALAVTQGITPVRDASGELKLVWNEQVTGPRVAPIPPPPYVPPNATIGLVEQAGDPAGLQPAVRLTPPQIVT